MSDVKKILFKNKYVLFGLVLFSDLLLNVISSVILENFYPNLLEDRGGLSAGDSQLIDFVLIILLAPLAETLLFQALPIQLILRYFKSNIIAVLISAVFFTSQHNYSWMYMVTIFPTAIIYAVYYSYIYRNNGGIRAFQWVFAVHALHNLIVFSMGEV